MYPKAISIFLFGSALAVASSADAQTFDFTPYSGRILSDPAYLPMGGQFEGVTSYDFRDARGISFDATGTEQSRLHQWSQQFTQDVQYGVLDDLTVGGSIEYDPFFEAKHDLVAGGETVRRPSGWADPSFNVNWRALDQAVQPINLDVFASYSPDWINAQAATNQDDGAIARGDRREPSASRSATSRAALRFTAALPPTYSGDRGSTIREPIRSPPSVHALATRSRSTPRRASMTCSR